MVGTTTLLYIRSIKCEISTEKSNVGATSALPTTECSGCQERMPISSLHQHKFECKSSMIYNSDESDDENTMLYKDDIKLTVASNVWEGKKNAHHHEVISILYDGEGASKGAWSSQLKHIVPDSEMEQLEEVSLQSASLDEAAELMLDKSYFALMLPTHRLTLLRNSPRNGSLITLALRQILISQGKFFQSMDVALKYGKVGFPNP